MEAARQALRDKMQALFLLEVRLYDPTLSSLTVSLSLLSLSLSPPWCQDARALSLLEMRDVWQLVWRGQLREGGGTCSKEGRAAGMEGGSWQVREAATN